MPEPLTRERLVAAAFAASHASPIGGATEAMAMAVARAVVEEVARETCAGCSGGADEATYDDGAWWHGIDPEQSDECDASDARNVLARLEAGT